MNADYEMLMNDQPGCEAWLQFVGCRMSFYDIRLRVKELMAVLELFDEGMRAAWKVNQRMELVSGRTGLRLTTHDLAALNDRIEFAAKETEYGAVMLRTGIVHDAQLMAWLHMYPMPIAGRLN